MKRFSPYNVKMLPVRANIPKPRNRQPLQPTSQLRGIASSVSKGRLNRSTVIEENNYSKEVKRGRAHNLSISHTRASVADSESTSVDNTQLATRPATRSLGHGPSDGLRMSIDSPFTEVSNLVTDGNDVKGHLEIQSVDSSFTNLDGSEATGTPQRASCPIIQSQSSLFSKHRRLFPSLNQSSMQDLMAISKPPATDLSINPPPQQLNFPSQDTPTSNKPETPSNANSPARRRFKALHNLFKSVSLFQTSEVRSITSTNEVVDEVMNYKVRKIEKLDVRSSDIKENHLEESLENFRRIEAFCECASIGSEKHIQAMTKMLEEDPKRHLIHRADPAHLINKKNGCGYTPLYLASKHGNLEVVKFLINEKADPNVAVKTDPFSKFTDTPLQAAVRWGHYAVVEFLVDNCEFSKQELMACVTSAPRKDIKLVLLKKVKKGHNKSCCFNF